MFLETWVQRPRHHLPPLLLLVSSWQRLAGVGMTHLSKTRKGKPLKIHPILMLAWCINHKLQLENKTSWELQYFWERAIRNIRLTLFWNYKERKTNFNKYWGIKIADIYWALTTARQRAQRCMVITAFNLYSRLWSRDENYHDFTVEETGKRREEEWELDNYQHFW